MPVDFAGLPCAYNEINNLVRQHRVRSLFNPSSANQKKLGRILVLSDSAHSFGAFYRGRKAGCLTDTSVFSFHAVKNLTTAEGGAVCLNLPGQFDNRKVYEELRIKSLHGQNKDALSKTKPGNWRYDVVEAGFKFNMTDIMASIGLVELARYETDTLVKRKHIFDLYTNALKHYDWAEIPLYEDKDRRSSYHVYALRIRGISEGQRDVIISNIFSRGVSVNVHFIPVPMMTYYKNLGYNILNYPSAFDNYSREISLPVFYDLKDDQIDCVAAAVIESVETVLQTELAK